MAEVAYNRGLLRIAAGDTPLDSADLRMLLIVGSSLPTGWDSPDLNTIADLDAVSSLNIHTERIALTSLTVTQDDANDRANADAANLSFAAAPGVTARAGVIVDYAGGGSDSTRFLVCASSTGFPQPLDGGLNITISDWARLSKAA